MEFFAPNYGDAALGHVWFDDAAALERGELTLEVASGTTDAEFTKYTDRIIAQLEDTALKVSEITNDPKKPGVFTLHCRATEEGESSPKAVDLTEENAQAPLSRMRGAFEALQKSIHNPVITARIINEINAYGRKRSAEIVEKGGSAWFMFPDVDERSSTRARR